MQTIHSHILGMHTIYSLGNLIVLLVGSAKSFKKLREADSGF